MALYNKVTPEDARGMLAAIRKERHLATDRDVFVTALKHEDMCADGYDAIKDHQQFERSGRTEIADYVPRFFELTTGLSTR